MSGLKNSRELGARSPPLSHFVSHLFRFPWWLRGERIHLPIQDSQIKSLGWEDPLERGMGKPIPVSLPGEFHGQRSLVGYSPRVCIFSNMEESELPTPLQIL